MKDKQKRDFCVSCDRYVDEILIELENENNKPPTSPQVRFNPK